MDLPFLCVCFSRQPGLQREESLSMALTDLLSGLLLTSTGLAKLQVISTVY